MRNPTKKQIALAKEFDDAAAEIAREEFDAVVTKDTLRGTMLKMDTEYGAMFIWPQTRPDKEPLFTVFCRFETDNKAVLQRAGREIGSNPFSGKYNFHDDRELDESIRAFRMHLQRVVVE